MIRHITTGKHLEISGSGGGSTYYNNNGAPMTGTVRFINNSFEVYDGTTWHSIQSSYPIINLTPIATKAIDWSIKQMQENEELEEMSKKHPAIQAAYDNFKRSAEQLKSTIILSKDESLETNS